VLEKTGSAASAGLVAAVSALPALLVAPFVGWLVDRFGRRPVSVISDVLSALAVASIPLMAMVGDLTYPTIMALAVLGATFDPAGYTARRSILPDAAEAADRPVDTLNGIHEGIFAIGWTVGPVAGAALIAAVGAAQSFWAPFVLFLIASACVAAMRVGDAGQRARAEAGADGRADRGWTSWTRGFTALWRDRPLRLVTIAVVILAAIYMPTEAVLLPTYFERLGEPGSLGIVISALSLGAMIGAFGYGWLARRLRLATIARLVLAGVALSIVPMALLPPLPVLAAAGFFLGLSWGPADPMMSTLVQTRIPPDEQGRVYGVQMSLFYAAPPIAMLIIGGVVEQLGLPTAYLALALLLAVFSVAALLSPRIRELDRPAPS
jgi:MFS family permease